MFKHKSDREMLIEGQNNLRMLQASHNTIETASAIAFVTMAESGAIDDITATENIGVFASWQSGIAYTANALREYGGCLYRCIQPHTSQEDWTPEKSPSLWKLAGDPSEEYPLWSQPIGAFDAYSIGDKVTHNYKKWISTAADNIWEPGVYGWEEV